MCVCVYMYMYMYTLCRGIRQLKLPSIYANRYMNN